MVKRSSGELLFSIAVDRAIDKSITTQVYGAMHQMILSGDLAAGKRLPSTRILAKELGISRTTAMAVFERLTSEGLIESRTGSGSFISNSAGAARPRQPLLVDAQGAPMSATLADIISDASPRFFQRLSHPQTPRPFMTGLPDYKAFPLATWARLTAKHWREPREEIMGYSDAAGDPHLRAVLAEHLRSNRGISCDPEQIFIVNGAQQAFDLIGRMLLNPGDFVWFENPGAIGARNSLIACGARMVPVPVDDEGLSVAEGLRMAPNFRLAFVTPSHQHPMGVEMSLQRRGELLAAAIRHQAWIIEDDYDGEFRYDNRPLPTLKSGDAGERVIYVGTFSKTMFPSLRLGFYIVPKPLAAVFKRISGAFLQGVPSSIQAVMAAFIEEGHFATHLRHMREIYAERHAAFHAAAQRHLGGLLHVKRSVAGFHVVGTFASPAMDEDKIMIDAAKAGLVVSPISRFCIEQSNVERGLVLGVSAIDTRMIEEGVRTLARVLEANRG
ncbi:PLP-dependent aminotransferase family protein [Rhizobium mayense]|uniref:PLP-dependent aminotransferase family protein n=1 Tax=Rhizobium mayense TaxID=1312184 RepID=A0ABT7JX77_9HYPH|nr:PLP-dependent aminotransferase family protein [Rhizobium mayense]MDL2400915.1 PLP-dependent aminotransferase family protein [Rhizobium mayense]